VVGYIDVLRGTVRVGARVAIIGAGGIGFDVAAFLTRQEPRDVGHNEMFFRHWGVDVNPDVPGGVKPRARAEPSRAVYLLQRKYDKVGTALGLTTGWIHRASLVANRVQMVSGATYNAIDDAGLHISVNGVAETLDVDTVVVCAGQLPHRDLYDELLSRGVHAHLIGGASVAAELDAKRAIREGAELASSM
jgi:2,4-dienoyl-CoA reductase (NADPH2)